LSQSRVKLLKLVALPLLSRPLQTDVVNCRSEENPSPANHHHRHPGILDQQPTNFCAANSTTRQNPPSTKCDETHSLPNQQSSPNPIARNKCPVSQDPSTQSGTQLLQVVPGPGPGPVNETWTSAAAYTPDSSAVLGLRTLHVALRNKRPGLQPPPYRHPSAQLELPAHRPFAWAPAVISGLALSLCLSNRQFPLPKGQPARILATFSLDTPGLLANVDPT
jgi:hypothetical protein